MILNLSDQILLQIYIWDKIYFNIIKLGQF